MNRPGAEVYCLALLHKWILNDDLPHWEEI
jgi:hypothetical protein